MSATEENVETPPPQADAAGKPAGKARREDRGGEGSSRREIGGPKGPEPTRYGDWEVGGRCTDF